MRSLILSSPAAVVVSNADSVGSILLVFTRLGGCYE